MLKYAHTLWANRQLYYISYGKTKSRTNSLTTKPWRRYNMKRYLSWRFIISTSIHYSEDTTKFFKSTKEDRVSQNQRKNKDIKQKLKSPKIFSSKIFLLMITSNWNLLRSVKNLSHSKELFFFVLYIYIYIIKYNRPSHWSWHMRAQLLS